METVDHRRPQASSHRDATRLYQPGIGPFGEDAAVAMTVTEMQAADKNTYANAGKRAIQGAVTCATWPSALSRTGPSRSSSHDSDATTARTRMLLSRRSFPIPR